MNRLSCLVGIALLMVAGAVRADNQPSHSGGGSGAGTLKSVLKQNRGERSPNITREERKAYAKVKFYKEVQKCWTQQEILNKILALAKAELSAAGTEKNKVERNIVGLKRELNHAGTYVSLEECLINASQNAISDQGKTPSFFCRESKVDWKALFDKIGTKANPVTPVPETNPDHTVKPSPVPTTPPRMPRAED